MNLAASLLLPADLAAGGRRALLPGASRRSTISRPTVVRSSRCEGAAPPGAGRRGPETAKTAVPTACQLRANYVLTTCFFVAWR
jgi:hypothetical protein